MKSTALIISMMALLTFSSMAQSEDINNLLANTETRKEIFNAILNDHAIMMEFMNTMKGNEHAMMMMNQNNKITGDNGNMDMKHERQNMDHGSTMDGMKANPEMMQKMMGKMMDMCEHDSTMRNKMANMMTEHPQMMKMCMQKMNEKGMMRKDGKIKMMEHKNVEGEIQHNN